MNRPDPPRNPNPSGTAPAMDERTLLAEAADKAGIRLTWTPEPEEIRSLRPGSSGARVSVDSETPRWSPLADPIQAHRLAEALRMDADVSFECETHAHLDIVEWLARSRGVRAILDPGHRANLARAAETGDAGLVRRLLDAGIRPAANERGLTPLMAAASAGREECLALLLSLRDGEGRPAADLEASDRRGFTALHHATSGPWFRPEPSSARCLSALLAAGADPAARDSLGRTPLMHAAARNNSEACALLLPVSDPDATDNEGNDASDWAFRSGSERSAEILRSHAEDRSISGAAEDPRPAKRIRPLP